MKPMYPPKHEVEYSSPDTMMRWFGGAFGGSMGCLFGCLGVLAILFIGFIVLAVLGAMLPDPGAL